MYYLKGAQCAKEDPIIRQLFTELQENFRNLESFKYVSVTFV